MRRQKRDRTISRAMEMKRHDLSVYLEHLGLACAEAAADARLLPLVFALRLLTPRTIMELAGTRRQRRIAA